MVVQTLNESDLSTRQESGPIATAEPISAQMVTTEKEGGKKLDSVTIREPLRLHLKDRLTETLRPLEHQILMLPTAFKIFSLPWLTAKKLRMLRSSTFSLFAPCTILQLYAWF
ncbi:hypothetical protein PoB_001808700 [Plakobranchus ocellatus]|uniref:Uncharacterized protein n=1 Tax=Plakobranchus ocellatus TaxID=259542 RepID=A0AAV3ZAL9_9GAST|nr:hypothetical protein PoB_001808700 [Plakobranchus ocellatus]